MKKISISILCLISSTAQAQGFLESLSDGLGSLFRQKSNLEAPPAKIPEGVLSHPAFQAPEPVIRSIEMKPRSSMGWTFGISDVEKIALSGRTSRSIFSALSSSVYTIKNATGEVTDYRQGVYALGGLYLLFSQTREASSQDERLKFPWRRGETMEIRDVSGSLFPMAVGNTLTFTEVFRNADDKQFTNQNQYSITSVVPAKTLYPQLRGQLFRVTTTNNGRRGCEYLWSEQLRYRLSVWCQGDSTEQPDLVAFELTPEGVQLADRIKAAEEQAAREEQMRLEAARLEKERQIADEEKRLIAEEQRRKAEEAKRYADDIATKKKISEALSDAQVERAVKLFDQAMGFFKEGQFDAAVLRFNDGLGIDPANGLAHYYLAETLTRQKKDVEARQHYRWTVDFAPDEKEAVLARVKLK